MLRILIESITVLLVVGVMLRLLERRLVFFPSKYPAGYWPPRALGLPAEDVWLSTSDGLTLHAWFVAHDSAVANLLLAHGNAGNLSDRTEWLARLHQSIPANLLMFDYRGYGRSTGSPSEEGCYRDAEAAYDWLAGKHPGLPIIAHGHSLGGAVAIELACRRSVRGLIIESSFTSARDMAKLMFGPLPLHWLSSMKWASDQKVARLAIPKLFLHGDRDHVIPYALGQQLFERAAPPKQFVTLAGADHNDTFVAGGARYYQAIRDFVLAQVPHKIPAAHSQ